MLSNLFSATTTTPTTTATPASDISTIFIIGFPDDFKERELDNMFLFAPGFEGAVLKTTNINPLTPSLSTAATATTIEESQRKQLIGFVKFSKSSEALYALENLNGRILDQERGIVIKAEIAKKNLFIKTSPIPINSSTTTAIARRLSSDEEDLFTPSSCTECSPCLIPFCNSCTPSSSSNTLSVGSSISRVMSITLPGQSDPALISAPKPVKTDLLVLEQPSIALSTCSPSPSQQPQQFLQSQQHVLLPKSPHPISDRIIDLCALQRSLIASPSLGIMAAIVGENFPCNTLYVGNLPPIAQEEELRSLFRNCLGYRRLSFRPKSSGPMCFVEFEDIACATVAMETLYGTMISCSSPAKGGIRLSFSKNPLGLRVASPVSSSVTSSSSFMEAIGAEPEDPNHQQAITTIFAHYYKNNPHGSKPF